MVHEESGGENARQSSCWCSETAQGECGFKSRCALEAVWLRIPLHAVITTDHAVITTDHAVITTDHPAIMTDHAVIATDHVVITTDHAVIMTDHPVITTDHPQ
eukprot:scaffold26023_cov75-Phaeocystis_antarctica.AAC.2